jgi:hypothetical protein
MLWRINPNEPHNSMSWLKIKHAEETVAALNKPERDTSGEPIQEARDELQDPHTGDKNPQPNAILTGGDSECKTASESLPCR